MLMQNANPGQVMSMEPPFFGLCEIIVKSQFLRGFYFRRPHKFQIGLWVIYVVYVSLTRKKLYWRCVHFSPIWLLWDCKAQWVAQKLTLDASNSNAS